MALIAVVSCKGAPGVTTAVLALGAVWPRPVVVAELDPAGGDLAARFHLAPTTGAVSLAASMPSDGAPTSVLAHCQPLPGGLPVLLGPDSWEQAAVTLTQVVPALRAIGTADVVADCGRMTPGSPAAAAVRASDAVLALARPETTDLCAALHWLRALEHPAGLLVLAGDGPHAGAGGEITRQWGVDCTALPTDRRAAVILAGGRPLGASVRLPLFNHARALAARLTRDLEPLSPAATTDASPTTGARRRGWTGRGAVEVGS